MQNNDIVRWYRLKRPGRWNLTTSYTTFEPHPHDWDATRRAEINFREFMDGRVSDLRRIEGWLGNSVVRDGILDRVDLDRPQHRVAVAVRVIDDRGWVATTLNWTALGNVVTDILVAVPASSMKNFDPAPFAGMVSLTNSDRRALVKKVNRELRQDAGGPAVFHISLVNGDAIEWLVQPETLDE